MAGRGGYDAGILLGVQNWRMAAWDHDAWWRLILEVITRRWVIAPWVMTMTSFDDTDSNPDIVQEEFMENSSIQLGTVRLVTLRIFSFTKFLRLIVVLFCLNLLCISLYFYN